MKWHYSPGTRSLVSMPMTMGTAIPTTASIAPREGNKAF